MSPEEQRDVEQAAAFAEGERIRGRVRQLIGDLDSEVLMQRGEILAAIDRADYSRAATAAHRAHQQVLKREVLRVVLEL